MVRSTVGVLSCLVTVLSVCAAVPAVAGAKPYGQIVVVAGSGETGYSGDGHAATDARIGDRGGIAVGPDGMLYLADSWGGRVRAVNGDGVIDTVPGTRALRSPETDGPERNGWQYSPSDRPGSVAIGPDGALYVLGNMTLRRRGPDGAFTTIIETTAAGIDDPHDIAVGPDGSVYLSGSIAEGDGAGVVRIDPAGKPAVIAGGGPLDPLGANGRPATEARLAGLSTRIAVDARGAVYLVAPGDSYSPRRPSTLHRIDPDGTLHTVAGAGEAGFSGDGGPADAAALSGELGGVAVAADGTVFFHDRMNRLVRTIDTRGVISSVASPVPFDAEGAPDLAIGPHGDVYLTSGARVYRMVRDGDEPAAGSGRAPDYPSRFPDDEPGTVRTVVGSGRDEDVREPRSAERHERLRIEVGPDGSRYYADAMRHRVMKVAADGTSTVLAGTGAADFAGDGGPAELAALNAPTGLAVGGDGSVYIADSGNERLRKVDPKGVITTVAGNGEQGDPGGTWGEYVTVHGDGGPATAATVTPADVAVGPDGSLYVAEDDDERVRRITPDGVVSTLAGGGDRYEEEADGHPAAETDFFRPIAVTVAPDGSVYLLEDDVETGAPAVRVIDRAGIIRTVAGDSYRSEYEAGFAGDGGPAVGADLNNPRDIATGPDGALYIADSYNGRVRVVSPGSGTISTLAGTGERADSGDRAAATNAAVNEPQTVAAGADGVVYLISTPGDRIRAIRGGTITTVATIAKPDDTLASGPATRTAVSVEAVAVDHDGSLLVTSRQGWLGRVDAKGTLSRFPQRPDLEIVDLVAVAPDGTRYVESGDVVYRLSRDGVPEPVAGGGPAQQQVNDQVEPGQAATLDTFGPVADLAVSPAGRLYVATDGGVYRLEDDGTLAARYRAQGEEEVHGIAVDAEDRLYVAAGEADRVYRVAADGKPTTFAGNGPSVTDNENGDGATEASLNYACDVAVDGGGNVYIGTFDGVRRVGTDGTITTVAGNSGIDGTRGQLDSMTFDRHGNLYYVDSLRHQVLAVVRPGELSDPFPWGTVIWLSAGALVLLAAGWFGLRRWPRRDDEATEPPAGPDSTTTPDAESAEEG